MEKLGEYLKSQREGKNIKLEDISSVTKISIHALELVEMSNWKKLPPEPFVKGFISAYAKFIGVDPKQCLSMYTEEVKGKVDSNKHLEVSKSSESSDPASVIEKSERVSSNWRLVVAASSVMGVLLVVAFIFLGKTEPTQIASTASTKQDSASESSIVENPLESPLTEKGSQEKQLKENETPKREVASVVTTPSEVMIQKNEPVSPGTHHKISITSKHHTWLKIVKDNEPPRELFLKEGANATYEASERIKVVLGNSSGADVVYNGEKAEGEQIRGTIRQYVFPNAARFPQDTSKKN